MSCSLLWLKDDFRVSNNQAITALIEDENKVKKAIYIFEKETYLLCEAQRWWLAKSLEIHKKKLENLNISLDVIHENTTKNTKKNNYNIPRLIEFTGISLVILTKIFAKKI